MSLLRDLATSQESNIEITKSEDIQELLRLAQEQQWGFSYLAITGHRITSYEIELASVDSKANTFIIVGDITHPAFEMKTPGFFRAHRGGISIMFNAELAFTATDLSLSELQCQTPDLVRFSQLRSTMRINMSDLADIPVEFHPNAEIMYTGKLFDLSATGAKIRFNGDMATHLGDPELVAYCGMLLPGEAKLDSRVQVLSCLYNSEQDASFIRCQFLELHYDSQLDLHELIHNSLKQKQQDSYCLAS